MRPNDHQLTEYGARRAELMRRIGSDGVAIVPAAHEQVRARDLDLDDHDAAMRIQRHQVNAPTAIQRHLRHRHQIMAEEQPGDAATHLRRAQWRAGVVDAGLWRKVEHSVG